MTARETVEIMIRTNRVSMTVWSPPEVQRALDAYRAEILREAWDVAHAEGSRLEEVAGIEAARGARCVAYLLRRMAEGPR